MFNSITGRLSARHSAVVFIQTDAIEWEIETTAQTIAQCPPPGESVRLLTVLWHREDSMKLYGFLTESERALFLQLVKVSGIGPKQALKILSGIPTSELVSALSAGDVARLQRVPGLGTKTAQKIILALKGSVDLAVGGSPAGTANELLVALLDMGFERRAAESALNQVRQTAVAGAEEPREDEILRRAIVVLSR